MLPDAPYVYFTGEAGVAAQGSVTLSGDCRETGGRGGGQEGKAGGRREKEGVFGGWGGHGVEAGFGLSVDVMGDGGDSWWALSDEELEV